VKLCESPTSFFFINHFFLIAFFSKGKKNQPNVKHTVLPKVSIRRMPQRVLRAKCLSSHTNVRWAQFDVCRLGMSPGYITLSYPRYPHHTSIRRLLLLTNTRGDYTELSGSSHGNFDAPCARRKIVLLAPALSELSHSQTPLSSTSTAPSRLH